MERGGEGWDRPEPEGYGGWGAMGGFGWAGGATGEQAGVPFGSVGPSTFCWPPGIRRELLPCLLVATFVFSLTDLVQRTGSKRCGCLGLALGGRPAAQVAVVRWDGGCGVAPPRNAEDTERPQLLFTQGA